MVSNLQPHIQGYPEDGDSRFLRSIGVLSPVYTASLSTDHHLTYLFFYHGTTGLVGQGLLIAKDTRLHSDTPQSVGFPWTSDQPEAENST